MARRIVIDVDANIANAQRVLGSLSNQLGVLERQANLVRAQNATLAQGSLGQPIGTGLPGDARPYVEGLRTTYQQFGNTIRQVTTFAKELNGTLLTGTTTSFAGNFQKANDILGVYGRYLESIPQLENAVISQARSEISALRGVTLSYEDLTVAVGRYERVATAGGFRVVNTATGRFAPTANYQAQQIYDRSRTDINNLRYNNIAAQALENAYGSARTETPPLPPNIGQIARESPDLLRKLTRAGIAGPTGDVAGLYTTGAAQSFKVQEDLVRQVTRVTGSFTDQYGAVKRINAEYDRSGGIITRFGGRLQGLGSSLTQIGRDFLKVAEFGIATIGVYGAFQKIGQSIGTVIQLDKQIRQLGITANLTSEQSRGLFSRLADVGIETATSLTEIIGTADGVALAVRKVGDTAQQTEDKIVSLTRSVGILTNLSGIDAVKATDLLTSAYKQLDLTVDQIPSLLDKVTAVAGGQSNAIADVITAVAQLGDAAKVGNLNLSELVGTVQVLSQVTAKTPAEVATSLKNLIGSLGGPASIKTLKEYGITLKDTQGNLKNILEIYGEINTKFQTGAIPEADQQAVVRAISGGPRRAPDAAALLGSYNQIANAVRIASNASNEATIANLKILDSTSAKLTQLQAQFDKFAYGKFGELIGNSVQNLSQILINVLGVLDKLDSGFFEFIGTLALLAVAGKALTFVFGNIVGAGSRVIENLGLMPAFLNRTGAAALKTADEFIALANAEAYAARTGGLAMVGGVGPSSPITGISGRIARAGGLRTIATPIIAGAATGAALDIATGASPKTMLQNALLGIGFTGLAIPDPTVSKVVAGIGLIGGGLLSLIPEEKKAQEAAGATSEELLQSVTAYQTASSAIQAITKDNENLGVSIDQLLEKQKKQTLTVADTQALQGYQDQYAKNVLAQINANIQLQDSFDALLKNVNNIQGLPAEIKTKIQLAVDGKLDPESLKQLTATITEQFLKAADPQKYGNIGDFSFKIPTVLDVNKVAALNTIKGVAAFLSNLPPIGIPTTLGVDQHESPLDTLIRVLSGPGESQSGLLKTALDLGAPFKGLFQAIDQAIAPASRFSSILSDIAVDKQNLATQGLLHLISSDDVDRGTKLLTLLEESTKLREQFKPVGPSQAGSLYDTRWLQNKQADADLANIAGIVGAAQANGFKLTEAAAISAGESYLRLAGKYKELGDKSQVLATIKAKFLDLGFTVEWAKTKTEELSSELASLKITNIRDIASSYKQEFSDLISQRNSIEAKLQGDQLAPASTKNEVASKNARIAADQEELAQVKALIIANANLRRQLLALNEVDPAGLDAFRKQLAGIHGLEPLIYADNKNLASTLFALAQQFGLTGDQVVKLGEKLAVLAVLVKQLDGLKAVIQVEIDTITANAATPGGVGQLEQPGVAATNAAIRSGQGPTQNYAKSIQDQIDGIKKYISDLFASGKGSSFGQPAPTGSGSGGSKAAGLNVSNLDIGDSIYQAQNRQALLDEAVKRARDLQHKIPGEDKAASNDLVALLHGTQLIENVRGVKEEYLRKAIDELTAVEKARLEFDTKADQIRRIRVGSGDFAAIANVPFNSNSGVSVGGPNGPINVNLNMSGQVLTPAQFDAMANKIASIIKRSIANG